MVLSYCSELVLVRVDVEAMHHNVLSIEPNLDDQTVSRVERWERYNGLKLCLNHE